MNKKNMMIMAGLMFAVATAMPSIGKQEREVVYALKSLGRDLSQEAIVMQNIDMFIPLFEMSSQIKESKLQEVSVKKSLAKAAAAIGGIATVRVFSTKGINFVRDLSTDLAKDLLYYCGYSRYGKISVIEISHECMLYAIGFGVSAAATYVALNFYDTFKTNNELQKSLALDKEILAELVAIKESMISQAPAAVNAQ